MNNCDISIILPCYNESGNIPLIIRRFRDLLENRRNVEVLLVNNGSTDNSQEIFNSELAKKENSFAKVVYVEVNKGYGFGIMAGVREASGQIIAWTHADMQTDPQDILLIYDKYENEILSGKFYAKGKRIKRSPIDTFFTWGMALIASFVLGVKLIDINAQPKVFSRSVLEILKNPPDDFSLDLYLMYQAKIKSVEVIEYPVSFSTRRYGQSKGGGSMQGKAKLVRRTLTYIVALAKNLNKKA